MSFPNAILKAELTADPLGRGYSGLTDRQAADSLNAVDRLRNRNSMSGDEVFQATDQTEFAAFTDVARSQWLAFCGRETIDPFAGANVAFVQDLFGAATLANLEAARQEPVSRAMELGLPVVHEGHVAKARA